MADEKDVKPASSPGPEVKDPVDEKGVPLKNRLAEYERKLGELTAKYDALKSVKEPEKTPTVDEQTAERQRKIAAFAEDPDRYIEALVEARDVQREADKAVSWVKSQEGYKPEYEVELLKTIRENGLMGRPLKRVEVAWQLFKLNNPDKFSDRSNKDEARDRELERYRAAGVGRPVGATPSSEKKTELLAKLRKTTNVNDQADILSQWSQYSLEEQMKRR